MTDDETYNTKVNLNNPVAKQRGAKFLILDVTKLKLTENAKLEFFAAFAKYYESNFWIEFKSVGIIVWMALLLAKSLQSFLKFGKLEEPMSHWKRKVFWFLELVDQVKDLVYLYGKDHKIWMSFFFSQTIIIPFLMNVTQTNVMQYRITNPHPLFS